MAEAANSLPRKKPNILWWIAGIFFLFFVWFLYQLVGPSPGIIVSKQTTHITEPLRRDGLPDFERHLLEQSRDGVTPENNAAVLLVQAMWPADLEPQNYVVVMRELGLAERPSASDALVSIGGPQTHARVRDWLKQIADETKGKRSVADVVASNETSDPENTADDSASADGDEKYDAYAEELVDAVLSRPWTSAEFPLFGKWIEENRKPIDLILEATKRPRCYFPSPSLLDNKEDTLIATLMPLLQSSRDAARALSARCMWNLGEGRFEEAWQDALAIHRLARLIGQGPALIDQLVAIAVDGVACEADLAIFEDPRLPAPLARQILKDLLALPAVGNVARSIDGMERLTALDAALYVKTHGLKPLMGNAGNDADLSQAATVLSIDWNQVLIELNGWCDELAAAVQIEDRAAREEALDRIDANMALAAQDVNEPANWLGGLLSRHRRSEMVSEFLAGLMLASSGAISHAQDRGRTQLDLTRVVAALATYRAEQGSYPAKLEDLVPQVIPNLPADIYSGQSFLYKRDADGRGYVLYSVFQNGKDDGGTHYDGSIVKGEWVEGDNRSNFNDTGDLVIRLPRPPRKLPKPLQTK